MNSFILFVSKWGKCHSLSLLKDKIILFFFFFLRVTDPPNKQLRKRSFRSVCVSAESADKPVNLRTEKNLLLHQHDTMPSLLPKWSAIANAYIAPKTRILPSSKLCHTEAEAYLGNPSTFKQHQATLCRQTLRDSDPQRRIKKNGPKAGGFWKLSFLVSILPAFLLPSLDVSVQRNTNHLVVSTLPWVL